MLINRMMEDWASQQAEPVKPLKVFGGITLNKTVGGLNPVAVEKCLGFPRHEVCLAADGRLLSSSARRL